VAIDGPPAHGAPRPRHLRHLLPRRHRARPLAALRTAHSSLPTTVVL
jgi:hypothetical protein